MSPTQARTNDLSTHCTLDHEWLLERLHSLDNCLDNLLYYGEVCSDLRGFGGLRQRCQEVQEMLKRHVPEEEELFTALTGKPELRPLLLRLLEEHRAIDRELENALDVLEALAEGELLPDDLFSLQDRVRALSAALQDHIATENRTVLPLLKAA